VSRAPPSYGINQKSTLTSVIVSSLGTSAPNPKKSIAVITKILVIFVACRNLAPHSHLLNVRGSLGIWVIALMSALMLGVVFGFENTSELTDPDPSDAPQDEGMEPDPVAPLADPMPEPALETVEEDTTEPELEPASPEPIVSEEIGETFELLSNQSATGTGSDDRFVLIEGERLPSDGTAISISGGAGDDTFDLLNPTGEADTLNSPFLFSEALVDGGAGNDTINVAAPDSTVSGGDGDDRINVVVAGNTFITGDAGDDYIFGDQVNDPVTIQGGTGNDTIDATDISNVAAFGDEGNDQIMVTGRDLLGTGYSTFASGGDGEDTLSLPDEAFRSDPRFMPIGLRGDAGNDIFELTFNEGREIDVPLDATPPASVFVAELLDFEPGIDAILIEPQVMNDAFEITQARLDENATAGTTELIISYQSETEIDREVRVIINATGISFDDISLVGIDDAALTTPLIS
jgi:hypothetical protein